MDRINTASKAVDLFGAGKHGFNNRNVGLGVNPTDFNAEWANGVQEELLSIIEAASVPPDIAVRTQVRQAIKRLFGGNLTTVNFAASPFALTADHAGLVLVDATAGNVVINMPTAANVKAFPFVLRRIDATANTVTINRTGADTLDGATSAPLIGNGQWVFYKSDGVSQFVAQAASTGVMRFPAGGTFTVPAGVKQIYVSGAGGGGGGGGSGGVSGASSAYSCTGGGSGGGAGSYGVRQAVTVAPGQLLTVAIGGAGSAGAAGAAGGNGGNGGVGGSTSLTGAAPVVNVTYAGGPAGAFSSGVTGSAIVGNPGTPASGAGATAGHFGLAITSYAYNIGGNGGSGGNNPFGNGGGGGISGIGGQGGNGNGAGGGGAGGVVTISSAVGQAGAAGTAGLLIIEW